MHSSASPVRVPRSAASSPAALRLLSLIALLPGSLVAQTTFTWIAPGTADWNSGIDWNQAGAPSPSDDAIINNGGTASVTDNASAANAYVGDNGGAGAITVDAGGTLTLSGALYVGCGCVPSTFTVNSGGLGSSAFISIYAGSTFTATGEDAAWASTGSVTLSGASASLSVLSRATLAVGSNLTLGGNGNDSLTIGNGGVVTTTVTSILGYNAGHTSTATVDGSGSIWNTGNLTVGVFGAGDLTIRNGGVVNTVNADLANGNAGGPGSTIGTVLVTGAGSQWNVSGAFKIGGYADEDYYNSGTLSIADGGAVTVTADGGAGTVEIHNNGTLEIGAGGTSGTLNAAEVSLINTAPDEDAPSAAPATLRFDHTDDIIFASAITGEGRVIKDNTGTVTLTGASTYSGPTLVNAGTLVIDLGHKWSASTTFQVAGANTVLRIGAGSTVAADLTVTDGTVEVAGQLDGGDFESIFTNATLRILTDGQAIGGIYTLNGASALEASSAGAIDGGSFLFNDTSTFNSSTAGAMTDGELVFAGTRTMALPDAGVITGGHVVLIENVSTTLTNPGQVVSTFDEDGYLLTEVTLDLYDSAHATIAATAAVDSSLVSLWDHSTLSITTAGGITKGELGIFDNAVVTLGVADALNNTDLLVLDNGTLVLNGYNTTVIGLSGDGRVVNDSTTAATLTLDTSTECGCGSQSLFAGTFSDGTGGGALGITITSNGTLYVGSAFTHTGPTRVVGAELVVVKLDDFGFAGSITASPITLEAGAILAGNGTVGSVTVVPGGTVSAILSPGDDISGHVGTLTTGNVTLAGDVEWEVNLANATAGAGVGTDLIQSVSGSFTFSSTPGDTLTIFLISGDGAGSSSFANFNATADGVWTLASFGGGIVGYDRSKIIVDPSYFGDSVNGIWDTRLGNNDKDIELTYTAIPEPAAATALVTLAALGFVSRRRRA